MVKSIGNRVVKKKKKKTKNKRKIQMGGMHPGNSSNSTPAEILGGSNSTPAEILHGAFDKISLIIGSSEHFVRVNMDGGAVQMGGNRGINPVLGKDAGHRLGEGSFGEVYKATIEGREYAIKIAKYPEPGRFDNEAKRLEHQAGLIKDTMNELNMGLTFTARSTRNPLLPSVPPPDQQVRRSTDSKWIAGSDRGDHLYTNAPPHPNIAHLQWAIIQPNAVPVLCNELCAVSLDRQLYVEQWEPQETDILKFIMEIGSAVGHLHTAYTGVHGHAIPILHRDLKSGNILLTDRPNPGKPFEGSFKLTDFGLTREKSLDASTRPTAPARGAGAYSIKTGTMTGCGSVLWMAPEILRGELYNEKIDIYSFGMTILEMVTCKLPWKNVKNPYEVPTEVSQGRRPDTQLRGHSGWSVQIINSCWTQEPGERPDAGTLKAEAEGLSLQLAQGAAHDPPVQGQTPALDTIVEGEPQPEPDSR